MSFRYLLRTPPRTYSPSDYRTFSQTQFMWLRCPAKMREMAAVTGATGVPTLPREHQRTVSFMAATSDYFHEVKSIWPLNTKWCPKTIEGLINLSHLNLNMSPKSLRPSLHSKSTTFSLTATVCAVSLITPQYNARNTWNTWWKDLLNLWICSFLMLSCRFIRHGGMMFLLFLWLTKRFSFLSSFFGLGPTSKPDLWKIITEGDHINERRVEFICKVNSNITLNLTQKTITPNNTNITACIGKHKTPKRINHSCSGSA